MAAETVAAWYEPKVALCRTLTWFLKFAVRQQNARNP